MRVQLYVFLIKLQDSIVPCSEMPPAVRLLLLAEVVRFPAVKTSQSQGKVHSRLRLILEYH